MIGLNASQPTPTRGDRVDPRPWNILTSEFPPDPGGVSDFCGVLARTLTDAGMSVKVWAPTRTSDSPNHSNFLENGAGRGSTIVERIPNLFQLDGRRTLERNLVRQRDRPRLLVQYVPNAFGMRGMNVGMCHWLARRRRLGDEIGVLFHEPFFYFGWQRPQRNLLALIQRYMAWTLMRGASKVYVSTPTWERYLQPYARPGKLRFIWLPLPATLPVVNDPQGVSERRAGFVTLDADSNLFGHFGTYGADIAEPLEALLPSLLNPQPSAHFLCIGRRSDHFCSQFQSSHPQLAARVHSTGDLNPTEASLHIQACDVFIQPYPDGVTARRTSVINLLAHGCAVVTTQGKLTEDFWDSSKSCLLVLPTDVQGLVNTALEVGSSPQSIALCGSRAKAFYDKTFHPHRLMQCLMME